MVTKEKFRELTLEREIFYFSSVIIKESIEKKLKRILKQRVVLNPVSTFDYNLSVRYDMDFRYTIILNPVHNEISKIIVSPYPKDYRKYLPKSKFFEVIFDKSISGKQLLIGLRSTFKNDYHKFMSFYKSKQPLTENSINVLKRSIAPKSKVIKGKKWKLMNFDFLTPSEANVFHETMKARKKTDYYSKIIKIKDNIFLYYLQK